MSSIDEIDKPPGLGLLPKLHENASKRAKKHVDLEDGEINDDESQGLTKAAPSELETHLKTSEDSIKSRDALPPDQPIISKILLEPLNTAQIFALPPKHGEIEMEPETVTEPHRSPGRTVDMQPLSPEDLDHAKSVVLDLLGWGVQPEYLIECGVSPQAIFKIFTDLRLRLPQNLFLPPAV